jgi:predicted lipoprotein with Yx(FWY)xxD motif
MVFKSAFLTLIVALLATSAYSTYTVIDSTSKSYGSYLTDSNGYTMYTFAADSHSPSNSTCYGNCASIWPPYTVTANAALTVGSGVTTGLIAEVERTDGTYIVTFNGWPLYYFANEPANDITC